MSDQTEVYKESDTHIPVATEQVGTMDTSGTAGAAHSKLEAVTPIFDVANAQNALVAQAALDPDQPDVPEYLVTLPTTQLTEVLDKDAIKARIDGQADQAKENPVLLGGPNEFQRKAAEEGEQAAQDAEVERTEQGGSSAGGSVQSVGTPKLSEGVSAGSGPSEASKTEPTSSPTPPRTTRR